VVNLGVGLPEAVASEAAKLGRLSEFALTVEAGPVGGVPAAGLDFGCSRSPHAVLDQPAMCDSTAHAVPALSTAPVPITLHCMRALFSLCRERALCVAQV
jgi:acyl CoA:acetate/3-ketoacid CoA transferase